MFRKQKRKGNQINIKTTLCKPFGTAPPSKLVHEETAGNYVPRCLCMDAKKRRTKNVSHFFASSDKLDVIAVASI